MRVVWRKLRKRIVMSTAFDECKDNDRPWESPGAVRRDCEPHRAHLVNLLGALSMACGIGSLCLGITGIAGLILGITACCLATSDLRKMSAGLMDSSGLAETQVGHER